MSNREKRLKSLEEKNGIALPKKNRTSRRASGLDDGVSREDFYSYLPSRQYIFVPNRELWPGASVNARLGKKSTKWLDDHRSVEQAVWAPGCPEIIQNRLVAQGGWIEKPGAKCFNLYLPPQSMPGDAKQASRWVEHVEFLYPDEADHIIKWLAHRAQRPGEKINHALCLGGNPGTGKDSLLFPVGFAIGPWNLADVSPMQVMGRFNGFIKSVILRISEARDLGDTDRFRFYESLKTLLASPPDTLRCDEKNIKEHSVLNACGIVITTNHRHDGLYLPADDRRHFVCWSDRIKDDFDQGYWNDLYQWYDEGGIWDVAAYLRELDLSAFDPKAPPPKTAAFWSIVDAGRAPEEGELADVIDSLGKPKAVTLDQLIDEAKSIDAIDFWQWLKERTNRRKIPHRMESIGYVPVRNPTAKDGLWKINGRRQVIYVWDSLHAREQIKEAQKL